MNHLQKTNSPLKSISLLLSLTMILGSQPAMAYDELIEPTDDTMPIATPGADEMGSIEVQNLANVYEIINNTYNNSNTVDQSMGAGDTDGSTPAQAAPDAGGNPTDGAATAPEVVSPGASNISGEDLEALAGNPDYDPLSGCDNPETTEHIKDLEELKEAIEEVQRLRDQSPWEIITEISEDIVEDIKEEVSEIVKDVTDLVKDLDDAVKDYFNSFFADDTTSNSATTPVDPAANVGAGDTDGAAPAPAAPDAGQDQTKEPVQPEEVATPTEVAPEVVSPTAPNTREAEAANDAAYNPQPGCDDPEPKNRDYVEPPVQSIGDPPGATYGPEYEESTMDVKTEEQAIEDMTAKELAEYDRKLF